MTLPRPLEVELLNYNKSEYFARLLNMDLDKRFKIESTELHKWIHYNYQSVLLDNKELNYNQFKKI